MKIYFDSSVLVAVYVTERDSTSARSLLVQHNRVPWTPIHDLEVRNALRLAHGRSEIDESQLEDLLSHIDADLHAGRLDRPALSLDAVFQRAVEVSEGGASRTRCRALDILHVASALELECTTLVTGDERQMALARLSRLRTMSFHADRSDSPSP